MMTCPYCDGTTRCVEPGEFAYQCQHCDEGVAICVICGGSADRQNEDGTLLCDAHYFAHEVAA